MADNDKQTEDERGITRRRFLEATGGTAAVATVAGCQGGGDDGGATDTPTATATATETMGDGTPATETTTQGTTQEQIENPIERAREIMEEAGYGPDNQYTLQWTQYESDSWLEMAQILRDQLASAHVDMKIQQAPFATLLQRGREGNLDAYTLGWIADWPAPDNFLQLLNPPQTDTSQAGPVSYLNWNSETGDHAQEAADAYETIANNLAPTEEAQQARAEAYVTIEEANWQDVGFVNVFHSLSEGFWYDTISNYTPFGGMGRSRQMFTGVQKQGGNTFNLIMGTATTLDPIAATDTESGEIIMQIFDALTNYQDGTTTVTNLLASDFEVSDDFTTYEFSIHEDATFHNGDPVTAQDIIYSWERLAQSENSRRSYFILDSLSVEHETDDEGNYVPDSLALEAVDDKTLRIQLDQAFHATLEMLAYTSFAAVPEGIVGDIEGYDGEMSYQNFSTKPEGAGAGPFEFDMWNSGTEAQVTRYDDYYREPANIRRVHWQVIEKDPAQYNYAMNKNADMFGIPTSFYDPNKVNVEQTDDQGRQLGTYGPLRNNETANYVGVPTIDCFYVGFNMEQVEKPVRRAFAYVMDQDLMVREVFKDRGQPAYHFTPPSIYPGGAQAYQQHARQNYPYGYGGQNG